MAYQFKSYTGKDTDVLHSKNFLSKSFKEREKIAFDKNARASMSEKDKLLMQGYATAVAQANKARAYNYYNPKGGSNNSGSNTASAKTKNTVAAPF